MRIKVSTEVMQTTAEDISTDISRLEEQWNELADIITSSQEYWEGEASLRHQKYLTDHRKEVERILRRLKEHPVDLMKMAGIYRSTEDKALEASEALQSDVLV